MWLRQFIALKEQTRANRLFLSGQAYRYLEQQTQGQRWNDKTSTDKSLRIAELRFKRGDKRTKDHWLFDFAPECKREVKKHIYRSSGFEFANQNTTDSDSPWECFSINSGFISAPIGYFYQVFNFFFKKTGKSTCFKTLMSRSDE